MMTSGDLCGCFGTDDVVLRSGVLKRRRTLSTDVVLMRIRLHPDSGRDMTQW